jgi:hypothetical protein
MLFGEMITSIVSWSREAGEPSIAADALNDAIESLSDILLCVRLGDFMGGPVTISLKQGDERTNIVSIPDPTSVPIVNSNPVAGSTTPLRNISVAITLVTPSGSETLPSPLYTGTLQAGYMLTVASPIVDVSYSAQVYGWCAYLLVTSPNTGQQWQRMNAQPLSLGQSFAEPILPTDASFPTIPLPTQNATGDTIFYIDHMECELPNGTWKAWNQGDLDGDFMRKASGIIAAASQHQSYAFDVVNNSQVEIRPRVSMDLSPRYFFVKRPGRIQFPDVQLPFQNVSSTEPYLRYEALTLLFMSLNEPTQAAMWGAKAADKLQSIRTTQTRTRARKELRVQHYRGML